MLEFVIFFSRGCVFILFYFCRTCYGILVCYGLMSDSTYNMFTRVCNYSRYVSEYYKDLVSPLCSKVMSQVNRETRKFMHKYDVTLDVCISLVLSQSKVICPQSL